MPIPNKGESKDDFISRCMGYDDMQKYDQDQRAAICYSKWNEENEEQAVDNEEDAWGNTGTPHKCSQCGGHGEEYTDETCMQCGGYGWINESTQVSEKAESKAQQRLMGMVYAYKKGELKNPPEKVKQIADSMSLEDAKEYAETKHKSLPSHVEEKITRETARSMSFGEFLDYTTPRNLNE